MNPESKKGFTKTPSSKHSPSIHAPVDRRKNTIALAIATALSALSANGCGGEFKTADPITEPNDGGVADSGTDATPDAPDCNFINVSLSPLSPASQTVPKGATNVVWTCWKFENGCNQNEINKITLTKSGNGQNTDLEDIMLTDINGTTLAGPVTLNETAKIELTDTWALEADTQTDICARVNIAPDAAANGKHSLSINLPSDIQTDIPAEGEFPLSGNELTIANATVGNATVEKNGVLQPGLAVSEQFIIGQFSVLLDSEEDGRLEQIRLRLPAECGTENMQNFHLIDQNSPLPIASEPTATADGFATFNLQTPLEIHKASQLNFWATADINCQPGDTLKSCIANESDIVISGNTYGFNLHIINNHDCQTNAQETVLE